MCGVDETVNNAAMRATVKEAAGEDLFQSIVDLVSTYDRAYLRPVSTNPATFKALGEDL